jgi:hypothetical protein
MGQAVPEKYCADPQPQPIQIIRLALIAGVIFFLTGQSQWYLLGLLAMASVFTLVRASNTP